VGSHDVYDLSGFCRPPPSGVAVALHAHYATNNNNNNTIFLTKIIAIERACDRKHPSQSFALVRMKFIKKIPHGPPKSEQLARGRVSRMSTRLSSSVQFKTGIFFF